MLPFIYGIVVWLIVPGIMLAILLFALRISSRVSGGDRRTSAWAGFLAGLLLFVAYVVSQLQTLHEPNFSFSYLPRFNLISAIIGFVVGFFFLWLLKLLVPTRLVGLITLIGADLRKKEGKSKTSPRCEKVDGDSPNALSFLRSNDVSQDPS